MKLRTLRYQPSTKPTGTATQHAEQDADEDALRRHQMSSGSRSCASSTKLASTACGVGTSAGLTRPLARIAYQSASRREPRRRDQGDARQGIAGLRLQSDERTIDHPFIARAHGQRQPGKPRPAAAGDRRVTAHVLRWPVKVPVRTSFGVMHDRPAVLVRIEDAEGAFGWGEAWCNFPACGAEHRARLVETLVAPLVVGRRFAVAARLLSRRDAKTAVLAIQSGEPGPIAQAIAAVDIALHDLAARRAEWRCGATCATATRRAQRRRRASGLCQRHQSRAAGRGGRGLRRAGTRAFKLKVGFGRERDVANLAAVRAAAGSRPT